jgi:hypothetical protein
LTELDLCMHPADMLTRRRPGIIALMDWATTVNGCSGGWRALCGAAGSEEKLRVYVLPSCSRAPIALYWMPKQQHLIPLGPLPGLAGTLTDLFVAFFVSVEAGKPDMTPLRTSTGARATECPAAKRASMAEPCSREAGSPPWPLNGLLSG